LSVSLVNEKEYAVIMSIQRTLSSPKLNTPHKTTILIVEDDDAIGDVLKDILTMEPGFRAFVAKNAQDAFTIMRTITPQLVLLDYQLPDMNGVELFDRMRRIGEFARIPIIIISANLPYAELTKRHLIGLEKPFDIDEVIQAVRWMLDLPSESFTPQSNVARRFS
jgi:DNA-binding response OmpR family regulator